MATKVGWGKIRLAACDGPFPKTFLQMQKKSRRYLLNRTSYSQFCSKFRCHAIRGQLGKMQLASFNGPFPKTPLSTQNSRRYFLHKLSY